MPIKEGEMRQTKGLSIDSRLVPRPERINGVESPTNAVENNGLISWAATSRHQRVGTVAR